MRVGRSSWAWALFMLLAVGVGGVGSVGCGGGVAIQSPHTINNGRPVDLTQQVILDTLPRRGWTTENVQPQRINAFLALRKHLLRVQITYDANQVNIFYVDSDNLSAHVESDGRVYAHRAVNNWISVLARDIANALAAAQPGVAPPPVTPVPSPPPA
jgi:hypothetical protein